MKGYVHSIEKVAQQNTTFRTVLYTAKHCQLVVMSLKPGGDIGAEVHKLDQFFRVEEGEGKAVLDGIEHRIKPGFAVLVPAGTRHNIINGPSGPMKLYTLYGSAEPSRWRSARHEGGRRGRQRALRREDDRIAICPTIARGDTLGSRCSGRTPRASRSMSAKAAISIRSRGKCRSVASQSECEEVQCSVGAATGDRPCRLDSYSSSSLSSFC